MEKYILHTSASRGHANHGWLDSYHSFSFAGYYNPERIHFGALRVLNDDTIAGGQGFDTHPHDNMEIISIPLSGALEHKDSMGNSSVIRAGEIQVMSAGTGVYHSEFNHYPDKQGQFLQIWIFPDKKNVTPRYDQLSLNPEDRKNKLQQILSPNSDDAGVWIHQQAWMHLGRFENNFNFDYEVRKNRNGVYAFVIEGSFNIDGNSLGARDALAISEAEKIEIKSTAENSEILLIEVPMEW